MSAASFPAVVTVSAPYGAGGSEIGPRVAEALGVAFLDRAIPTAVAERLAVPLEQALRDDEAPPVALERLLRSFATLVPLTAGAPVQPYPEESFVRATEGVIRQRIEQGGGVVLGRAGAFRAGRGPRRSRSGSGRRGPAGPSVPAGGGRSGRR